jgi:phosphoglycolate phosphatase-like HAD superfamily hydrolase
VADDNKQLHQYYIVKEFKSFNPQCILFDIDGVLVDIRKSYNIVIKKTIDFILKYAAGNTFLKGIVNDEIILKFRQTGGFNNDTDTTYAIALAILLNPQKSIRSTREFLSFIAKNTDEDGITSVEKFLSSYFHYADVQKLKEKLVYPAPVGNSLLATIFDEFFYGPKLFLKYHKIKPKYYFGKPLIENDKLLATSSTINELAKKFGGNVAIISGRSKLAAEYSLKPIFNIFNHRACIFLEDEEREYSKPNPYAIKKAMKVMNSKTAIYVGDSTEDLLMVRRAEKETDTKIAFFGVYGCSTRPALTARQFRKIGAEAIIENVNILPNILNKVLIKE